MRRFSVGASPNHTLSMNILWKNLFVSILLEEKYLLSVLPNGYFLIFYLIQNTSLKRMESSKITFIVCVAKRLFSNLSVYLDGHTNILYALS